MALFLTIDRFRYFGSTQHAGKIFDSHTVLTSGWM